jgi:hypothetical protein
MILEPYDHRKMFPTFGFGGRPIYMNAPSVMHCFPLNGNPADPSIFGIQNVLQTYTNSIP